MCLNMREKVHIWIWGGGLYNQSSLFRLVVQCPSYFDNQYMYLDGGVSEQLLSIFLSNSAMLRYCFVFKCKYIKTYTIINIHIIILHDCSNYKIWNGHIRLQSVSKYPLVICYLFTHKNGMKCRHGLYVYYNVFR